MRIDRGNPPRGPIERNVMPPQPTERTAPGVLLPHPGLAALLSFLIPGLGQISQGRVGKGILFLVLLLGTFSFGMRLGDSHVVYWEWTRDLSELHYPYLCQMFVGLPALPAFLQATAKYYQIEGPLPIL